VTAGKVTREMAQAIAPCEERAYMIACMALRIPKISMKNAIILTLIK
jgi:hypothetical protein